MAKFAASAQYDDWIALAAADDAPDNLFNYLRREKWIRDEQFPVGVCVYITDDRYFSCEVLVVEADGADAARLINSTEGAILTQRIGLELTHEQFQKLFKRFSIVLSPSTSSIIDREINED